MAFPKFLEIRLPDCIAYGSSFGPAWRTDVVQVASGKETRTGWWANPIYSGDVAYGVQSQHDMELLIAFFHEMRGKAVGFRFKDHLDYTATDQPLLPDGGPTVQLRKTYGTGANNYVRTITKPVAGQVFMTRNGSQFTEFVVDDTTGIATFNPDSTVSISNIAQDASGVVTATGHGFATGDEIHIDGVGGMTEVNGNVYTITVVDVDTFTLGVNTTGFAAYTGSGTASKFVQSGDSLLWSGEFDVPVRFDTDKLDATFDAYDSLSANVPITEFRLR